MTDRVSLALATAALITAALAAQQPPDRTHPPQPGPPPALNLPSIQKRQLSNGLPIWMVAMNKVPVVQVNLVVFGGTADDPAGKFGVAGLATAMLTEGAGSRSTLAIADAVDFLGAELGAGSGIDASALRLHVPAALPAVQQPATRTAVYLIDKPGAAQSEIRIGWIGVPRSTPDYFPIQVLNTILGGSFTSRLNMNLREEHGYAYGAGSRFDMRVSAGPFAASAGVQTDKTSESLKEFFNELNGILKPIPADELARAKNYVALRFPAGFETTADISRKLEDLLVYRLPEDYFSKYVQNIEAVTAADVQRVAQKYIQPDRFAVVVVGDRKAIEPGIKALNLGAIKVLTIDDIFGPAPTV